MRVWRLLLICIGITVIILIANEVKAHELDNHPADSIVASQVDQNNEEQVRALLEHLSAHWTGMVVDEGYTVDSLLAFRTILRMKAGPWASDDLYVIRLNSTESDITIHPYHPAGQSGRLDDPAGIGQSLADKATANPGEIQCSPYALDGEQRVACAISNPFSGRGMPTIGTFMAGFHHTFEDINFDHIVCPEANPKVTAADVVDDETLEDFVREATSYFLPILLSGDALVNRICLRRFPWIDGPIYLFRSAVDSGQVIFHGISPELENNSFADLRDQAGTLIASLLREEARSQSPLEGGFVEYYWDDPTTPDDDLDVTDPEVCPTGPKTCATGTSLKRTFIISIPKELSGLGDDMFMAAGRYIEEESEGGCSLTRDGKKPSPLSYLIALLFIGGILAVSVTVKGETNE